MKFSVQVSQENEGKSLWKFLKKLLKEVPLSRIEKLFRKQDVRVNGRKRVNKKVILKAKDVVEIFGVSFSTNQFNVLQSRKNNVTFSILFEDSNLLIINKPPGVSVHGGENSLDEQVLVYLGVQNTPESFLPTHVGRLDKPVSGLICYAKNYKTLRELQDKWHFFIKNYLFVSDFNSESKLIDLQLRHNDAAKKMEVVSEGGRRAKTLLYSTLSYKKARPLTGRKHQIRLTLSYLGSPILGDVKYGGSPASRLFLHSYEIMFYNLGGDLEYLNNLHIVCGVAW